MMDAGARKDLKYRPRTEFPLRRGLGGCQTPQCAPKHPPESPFKGGHAQRFKGGHAQRLGYILFETLVAMTLLSIGLIAINRAMRETILVRGVSRDHTQARFLLEGLIGNLELQPELNEASGSGRFEGELSRFSYKWAVSKVEVPEPPLPSDMPAEEAEKFKLSAFYLAKIEATVSWQRSGRSYEQTAQTLWTPEKLFVPEEQKKP